MLCFFEMWWHRRLLKILQRLNKECGLTNEIKIWLIIFLTRHERRKIWTGTNHYLGVVRLICADEQLTTMIMDLLRFWWWKRRIINVPSHVLWNFGLNPFLLCGWWKKRFISVNSYLYPDTCRVMNSFLTFSIYSRRENNNPFHQREVDCPTSSLCRV